MPVKSSLKRKNVVRKKETPIPDSEGSDGSDSRVAQKIRWNGSVKEIEKTSEQHESDPESEDSEPTSDKSCMAASCNHRQVACAFYDPCRAIIYVLEDTQESGHFDITRTVLEQANPDVILTNFKSDERFIDILKEHADSNDVTLAIRPQKDFIPAKGHARVKALRFLSELPAEASEDGRPDTFANDTSPAAHSNAYDFMSRRQSANVDPSLELWKASIRMDNFASLNSSPLCLACVGALIDHLIRLNAVGDLEDAGIDGVEVHGIEVMSLERHMHINMDALLSLQVFDAESHASMHSSQTKEGLSLFGILNNTRTYLGRVLMHQWLLRPSMSLEVIRARHDAISCFLRPDNLGVSDAIHGRLKGIGNMSRTFHVLKTGRGSLKEWQALVKFSFHCVMLRESLSELVQASDVDVAQKLIGQLSASTFKDVGITINETIDWEESNNSARVCVRPHIDSQLDEWKHIYHGLDSVLSQIARQISQNVPSGFAKSLNVVYFPQLGFLICIPLLDDRAGEEALELMDGWAFQFASENHIYAKSAEMHDLDKHIGDLHPHIVDREIEIIQALLEKIIIHDTLMAAVCDTCAELDCLLSFAEAARAYNYTRPEMVDENVIDIRQGRHPLQDQVVDSFVPNDTFISGGSQPNSERDFDQNPNVLILTGANACGKSVYLKQVALIQCMAQIGCFVPAELARLGVVDKVFTRVQTRETVSKVQSAFMIDLNQVSLALRNCTERSLILLDEFGKGTVPTDGAGLFTAVLKHLVTRPGGCPKVLSATHFHDLFDDEILGPHPSIAFLHMEVLLASESGEILSPGATETDEGSTGRVMVNPADSITYLYRVANGVCLESHAAKCALMFGVPQRVVERAKYVSKTIRNNQTSRLVDEMMTEAELEELKEAEDCCRRFLEWDLSGDMKDNPSGIRSRLRKVLGMESVDNDM